MSEWSRNASHQQVAGTVQQQRHAVTAAAVQGGQQQVEANIPEPERSTKDGGAVKAGGAEGLPARAFRPDPVYPQGLDCS